MVSQAENAIFQISIPKAWLNFKQKQSCQTFCSQVAVTGGGRAQIQIGEGFMWSKSKETIEIWVFDDP